MIKFEHVVLASPEQMEFIIEGMRNPKNSWERSDSTIEILSCGAWPDSEMVFNLGINDCGLMENLADAGSEHRKYMRMMPVYVRITAPLYWWKEFDTYKIGTVSNSCSTMHKVMDHEFTEDDFSCEHLSEQSLNMLDETIDELNLLRDFYLRFDKDFEYIPYDSQKDIWLQVIQLLPSSYNQTRNIMMNYEVLCDIYRQRKNHKLEEWRNFCSWIDTLPYSYLITGKDETEEPADE